MGLFDSAIDAITSIFDSGAPSDASSAFSGFDPSAFAGAGETGGTSVLADSPSIFANAAPASIDAATSGFDLGNSINQAYKDSWLQSLFGGGTQGQLSQATLDSAANPLAAGNTLPSAQDQITNSQISGALNSLNPASASVIAPAAKKGLDTTTLALGALAALGSALSKQKQPQIPGPGSTAATQGALFNTPLAGKGPNGTFAPVRTPATFPNMTNQDWYTYGSRPALSFYNNNKVGFASGGSVGGRQPAISLTPGGNFGGSSSEAGQGAGAQGAGPSGGAGVGTSGYGNSAAASDTSAGRSSDLAGIAENVASFASGPLGALAGLAANTAMGNTSSMSLGAAIADALGWGVTSKDNATEASLNSQDVASAMDNAAASDAQGNAAAQATGDYGSPADFGAGFGNDNSGTGSSGGDSGGGGSGCYITTATVDHMGLDDKGPELTTLRKFRDNVMDKTPEGRAMVQEYNVVAPHIVKAINGQPNAAQIYRDLYTDYIAPAVVAAKKGDNQAALDHYGSMVKRLENTFPDKIMAAKGGGVRAQKSVFDTDDGAHYVRGGDTGQSDTRNAKLSDGEFVFDAQSVADIGDGNNEAGAKRLEEMRQEIAKHKGRAKVIPPKAKSPLEYLRKAS